MNMNKYICKCNLCKAACNTLDTYHKENFIRFILPAIYFSYIRDDINITLSLVQAIHESNWGLSTLALKAYNLFGIKWYDNCGFIKYEKITNEFINGKIIKINANFIKYNSWDQSIINHGLYLKTRKINNVLIYKEVLKNKDNYVMAIKEVKKAGYATDPEYIDKLIDLILYYKLDNFETCMKNLKTKNN